MTRTAPTFSSPRLARALGVALALTAVPAGSLLFGCDTAKFAAGTTAGVLKRAAPAIARFRDPDLAETTIAGSLGTSEGLLEVDPDNISLRHSLARTYSSFGYGFLEDHMERALASDAEDAQEQADHWAWRASQAYLRAKEVAVGGLDIRNGTPGGFAAAQAEGLPAFQAYVARFNDREQDTPLLFWGAYSWARWIGNNRENIAAIADLPYVNVLAERAAELDPTFMNYAPLALKAGLMGTLPEQLGGRPRDAKVEFDRLIELTNRRNLMYLVTEARICAVAMQDRALYRSLLEEALNFDVDQYPDERLQNTIAQRRARRYLAEIDNLFEPEGTEPKAAEPAPES